MLSSPRHFDVLILGGGAAGMFCAFRAAARGRRVALIEHQERLGKKIEISGGGRCNFTNIHASAENYLSENPSFCQSALAGYSPWDFLQLLQEHRITYYEKKLGQLFCSTSSRVIIEMLLTECRTHRVEIMTSCHIHNVTKTDRFQVTTSQGNFSTEALVIATGGLSFAKLGASDLGYRIAQQFGMRITPLRPALVPLTLPACESSFFKNLAGISFPVALSEEGVRFEEALLFTHRGVSGPAILQISSYWKPAKKLLVDLLPEQEKRESLKKEASSLALFPNLLSRYLPRRFAETWSERYGFLKSAKHYHQKEFAKILHLLHHWPLECLGTEGYPKAEVTAGGVSTSDLFSKTMEARSLRGLFFIGEVVDVTGWLGGYNFQWAWASANAAAQAL